MSKHGELAVIDLGTNTFHLLVVKAENDYWKEVHRERLFVNLAEHGINNIGENAWDRGMTALHRFSDTLKEINVREVRAVGTAALRRASNSRAFIEEALTQTGLSIRVIDGEMEANYIKWGVEAAMKSSKDAPLDKCIMDIGGGSIEFCLSAKGEIVYTGSFPVGVAVLYDLFQKTEPISDRDLKALNTHLDQTFAGLRDALNHYGQTHLVGASGSFEVLGTSVPDQLKLQPYIDFDPSQFKLLYSQVIGMNYKQRLAFPGIPASRARYFICALEVIRYALDNLGMKSIGISKYALKEGIVHEWIHDLA